MGKLYIRYIHKHNQVDIVQYIQRRNRRSVKYSINVGRGSVSEIHIQYIHLTKILLLLYIYISEE